MIDKDKITLDWITKVSKENRNADKILVEKVMAITHASKAAYVATLIKHDYKTIEKYSNPLQMKDWLIAEPMNTKLNRLKKSNPEAFFYWYKILYTGLSATGA